MGSITEFLASLPPPLDLRIAAPPPFATVVTRIREEIKLALAAGIFPEDTAIVVRKVQHRSIYAQITEWHGGAVFSPDYEMTIRDPSTAAAWSAPRRERLSPELARAIADLTLLVNRHNYDRSRPQEDSWDYGYSIEVNANIVEAVAKRAIRMEHDTAFVALVERARVAAATVGPKALASVCRRGFDAADAWDLERLIKMAARANGGPLVHDKRRGWVPAAPAAVTPPAPTSVVDDTALYSADNGRIACGRHLGATARATGRDISGQRIARVTPRDAASWLAAMGEPIQCETCQFTAPRVAAAE